MTEKSARFVRRLAAARRGQVILIFALFLTFCIAIMALALDMGMVQSIQTDLQRSADSAALAGARDLINGSSDAITAAKTFAKLNAAGTHELDDSEIQVEVGQWDKTAFAFVPNVTPLNAVRVTAMRKNAPFFFGKALGRDTYNTQASAVATAQPRDIMLVLDISGSMSNFDKMDQLKRAVDLFCAEISRQKGGDRIGVAVYSTNASLLSPLSSNISQVNSLVQGLDPDGYTNISGGMTIGRSELEKNGRFGAAQLMVLLTDGLVNRPISETVGRPLVVQEANKAAAKNLPVVTISFSSEADPTLMQQVADITHTVHFHVVGSVDSQEEELKQVFLKVAANHPLQLVE